MSGELWKAFQSVSSIMNLTIVPYGNAKETWRNETKLWQFTCQHGPDECWGNLFHSCFIYYYPQTSQHLPLIHCMESDNTDDIRSAAGKCAKQFSINTDPIEKCMNGRLGNTVQHANAVKTEQLNPPHKYVPWVTLNGVHTEDIQDKAQNDLVKLICDTYDGPNKPKACQ
jgi:interferon gamma-inducible protein 30